MNHSIWMIYHQMYDHYVSICLYVCYSVTDERSDACVSPTDECSCIRGLIVDGNS